jgi:taurine dioxygenase
MSATDGSAFGSKDDTPPFYKVKKLSPYFGIEALDINLNNPHLIKDNNFITHIKQDLVQHRAILFRSQTLTGQQQVDISAALGTIESTFCKHPKSPHDDIFRVSNDVTEGCTQVGRSWHIDGTFQFKPFKYQTMYFSSVCDGGDTYFIPLKELYNTFTQDEKQFYNKLWMVSGSREAPIHPLVYKHPFRMNDEQTLLFHCGLPSVRGWFCDAYGNANDDAQQILNGVDTSKMIPASTIQDQLTQKIESKLDELGLRMKWRQGDFLITDNLGLAHYASEGTQRGKDEAGLRILHRTTIVGGDETVT